MRCFDLRSLLTLLSLLLVSFCASAQTGALMLRPSNQLNQSSQPTVGSVAPAGATGALPAPVESFGRLPDALVESLVLDAAQQSKLDAAHEARRKMWNTNRLLRQAEYAELTKELSSDKFDPREVIALRKKTRAKIDAGFDDVQVNWLAFWDVLKPAQRQTLIVYMRDQHTLQGQASAAASAQRAYARARQQAALDRAEARAEAQGTSGSTANTAGRAAPSANTAPSGAVTAPK
jgi:Spy/CpxP family protein refolding chaperone